MTKLAWDTAGQRFYEAGCDRGVLYPNGGQGYAWNGLISVEEEVSGGDLDAFYYDGTKYLDWVANEDFSATLTAFSAPYEFGPCDGTATLAPGLFVTQQIRKPFGLSYRTGLGNDTQGLDRGYKLHLVYNATAAPFGRSANSINDEPAPEQLSWTINCVPPLTSTYKPTAHFIVDSTLVDSDILSQLEDLLYGTDDDTPSLPTQAAVITLLGG